MAGNSKIEWTDKVWNPIRGCSKVSDGCKNCYAERTAGRFYHPGQPYSSVISKPHNKPARWNGNIMFIPHLLELPLTWQEPQNIFVNSMSDLFHENVIRSMLNRIFAIMAVCSHHNFQILTKRPDRMKEYLESDPVDEINAEAAIIMEWSEMAICEWPLENVWLGTSAEDQQTLKDRALTLLSTPAANRWLSLEPLLSPVDVTCVEDDLIDGCRLTFNLLTGTAFDGSDHIDGIFSNPNTKIDWIVVGGESGPEARPFKQQWAQIILEDCKEENCPVFFKQFGSNPRDLLDKKISFKHRKGGEPKEWPTYLQVQNYPEKLIAK